jgi:hypothetical protein
VAYCAIVVISGGLASTAARVRRDTGVKLRSLTETLVGSWFGLCVRSSLAGAKGAPGAEQARKLLENSPPAGQTGLVLVGVAIIALGAGLANTRAAVREAGNALITTSKDPSPKRKKKGEGEGERASSSGAGSTASTSSPARTHAPEDSNANGATPASPAEATTPAHTDTGGNTYVDLCGSAIDPGQPAPSPRAAELRELWLGPAGLGATVAGCARAAVSVPGHPRVWYSVGACDGNIQSLGVSSPDARSAILLQQAARFALRQAEGGVLLSSSSRTGVGKGDLYVVNTVHGSYVLVRSQVGAAGHARDESERCSPSLGQNVPYTTVPPAMAHLWLYLANTVGWTWPTLTTGSGPGRIRRFSFRADAPSRTVVATGSCTSRNDCRIVVNGEAQHSTASALIGLEQILMLAPSATR